MDAQTKKKMLEEGKEEEKELEDGEFKREKGDIALYIRSVSVKARSWR